MAEQELAMPASRVGNEARPAGPERSRAAVSNGSKTQVADGDMDEQERKRVAVGLSPRRPTAKEAVQRPPSVQSLPVSPGVLAAVLVGVLAVTVGLVWINLAETRPAWWPDWNRAPVTQAVMVGDASTVTFALRLGDDFSGPESTLRQGTLSGEWRTELLAEQSVYRITVWPNRLAWSLLGVDDLGHYRLQTGVALDAQSVEGYAGLVVRHGPDEGFVLFAVDGSGRYSVQMQRRGVATILQAWTPSPFLQPAPSVNLLTVEDFGGQIRLYANQSLLYVLPDPDLPLGMVGLAAGTNGSEVAEVRFDWFQLHDAVIRPAP